MPYLLKVISTIEFNQYRCENVAQDLDFDNICPSVSPSHIDLCMPIMYSWSGTY